MLFHLLRVHLRDLPSKARSEYGFRMSSIEREKEKMTTWHSLAELGDKANDVDSGNERERKDINRMKSRDKSMCT